jgi:N,N'-diacetyllegionaminate synthase
MNKWVPAAGRCFVIGEVGLSHDGSLGMAHAFIDLVANTGADAVKFQTHLAASESTMEEPFRVQLSGQDATRFDYWTRTGFTPEQWKALAEHARARGLAFLSSPFSIEAANLLIGIGCDMLKIASGEVATLPLIECCAESGLPVLISSGMSDYAELDAAVETVRRRHNKFGVFQCTSSYPCPPSRLGLNVMADLLARYTCAVGLSDHTGKIFSGLAAASLGADMLEVHVCFSKDMYGPDVPSSLTQRDLAELVEGVRYIRQALDSPLDKDADAARSKDLRAIFTKSVVARTDIAAGTLLTRELLAFKKPGHGIPAAQYEALLGRELKRAVAMDHFFSMGDLADN